MRTTNVLHSFSPSVQFTSLDTFRWDSWPCTQSDNTQWRICQTVSSHSLVRCCDDPTPSSMIYFFLLISFFGRAFNFRAFVALRKERKTNIKMSGNQRNRNAICECMSELIKIVGTCVVFVASGRLYRYIFRQKISRKKHRINSFVTILKYHFVSRGFIWTK